MPKMHKMGIEMSCLKQECRVILHLIMTPYFKIVSGEMCIERYQNDMLGK